MKHVRQTNPVTKRKPARGDASKSWVLIFVRALRHGNPDLHSHLTAVLKKSTAGSYVIDDFI